MYWIIQYFLFEIFARHTLGSKICGPPLVRSMAVKLGTVGAAEGSRDDVDSDHWSALKGVGCVLGRLAGALVPAGGVFGTVGSSRRTAFSNLSGIAEIINDNVGGPAGLCLAGDTLQHSGRVLVRVGNGRPIRSVSRNCLHVFLNFKTISALQSIGRVGSQRVLYLHDSKACLLRLSFSS